MVAAAVVAGVVLVLAACTQTTSQTTASPSPDASPTPSSSPTPTTESPTPVGSPTPGATPPPVASPSPAALLITKLPFHVGEIGVTYAPVALGASGGVPPYKWSISSGALPAGLTLSTSGSTTGSPTAVGSSAFVVRVDDSAGAAAGVPRTISVVPHLSVSGACTESCSVEAGCLIVCGGFGSQSGGLAPYTYKVVTGLLPPGMGLHALALTGTFPEPPVCTNNCGFGPDRFTVVVTDALGATRSVNAVFDVFRHITISGPGALCSGFGCTTFLSYSGGDNSGPTVITSNVNCTSGCSGTNGEPPPNTLPAGFSATTGEGTIVVTFPGGTWVGTFNVTLYDQSPCGPSAFCVSNTVTQAADVNAG